MVEEMLPGLYRLQIPLPQNPLGSLNSYVIKGAERTLIIDTGMNRPECYSVISSGLKKLGVDLSRADFFLTHMHSDHSGLAATLAAGAAKIYTSQSDSEYINQVDPDGWRKMADYMGKNGFPPRELDYAVKNHPGRKYGTRQQIKFHIITDGDLIEAGGYRLRCIHTPGHTAGHTCLYERDKRLLFSGDHILFDITPNISLHSTHDNPLRDYLDSLDKVYNLDAGIVLPGHRGFAMDLKRRIDELKAHHGHRANEVLEILATGSRNAYEIASKMTWDMSYRSWGDFPIMQKWFAVSEALAHIRFLEGEGKICPETADHQTRFRLA